MPESPVPEPLAFDSVTARLSLPLLFAAQAQKEFFITKLWRGLIHSCMLPFWAKPTSHR